MDEEILKAYLQDMPALRDILLEDIGVCVTNKTAVLFCRNADALNAATIKTGDVLPADDPLIKTMAEGKADSCIVPKDLYGVPFKSILYPIKNPNGSVIGGIGIARSLEQQYRIEESTDNLFASLEETNASIQEISTGSENLNNIIESIAEAAKKTESNVQESNKVIGMIENIASQSNLLGLNAAIEAARSGDQGRGFTVVANEMRKLAELSKDSSQRVSKALSEISKNIEQIYKTINEAQNISEGQAAATEEITATLEEITANAQIMVDIAKVN